ncbi:MAG: hypothetical protein JOY77_01925, partial [Alphaproteobacteria bacterium]|nr:hypothetical protein [Alphaproteobacteria bacterium]
LPDYTPEQINPANLGYPALLELCCTNYFVRNLWHNYVHTVHHKINLANYRSFGGTARHAMDFEADNWSNILLVESYGHRVRTDNHHDRVANKEVMRLLRQNKCDTLFSLRAGARKEDQRLSDDHLEHVDEGEWRLRRSVAGYVSGWLLVSEAAAAHVTVHHRGGLSARSGLPKRTHDGLVVCVNGLQIPISGIDPSTERTYQERREMLKTIGVRVEAEYKNALRSDPALQAYATASLDAMRRRLVPSQIG